PLAFEAASLSGLERLGASSSVSSSSSSSLESTPPEKIFLREASSSDSDSGSEPSSESMMIGLPKLLSTRSAWVLATSRRLDPGREGLELPSWPPSLDRFQGGPMSEWSGPPRAGVVLDGRLRGPGPADALLLSEDSEAPRPILQLAQIPT